MSTKIVITESNRTLAHIVIKVSLLSFTVIQVFIHYYCKTVFFCVIHFFSAFSEASACGKHMKKHSIKNDQTADNEK